MAEARIEAYYERLSRMDRDAVEIAESKSDLFKEMKGTGCSKAQIDGVKLRVKRDRKSDDKRAAEIEAEEVSDSLGQLSGTPLANAAVERAREYAN